MKTVRIKIYKFSELSPEARQRAINEHRAFLAEDGAQFIFSEAAATLDKFCDIFSIKYRQIDFFEPYRNDFTIQLDDDVLALSGIRLMAYIWNNYRTQIYKGRYYHVKANHPLKHRRVKSTTFKNGNTHNAYHSAIQIEADNCPLTGVCYDYPILKPLLAALNSPSGDTFEEVLSACISELCKDVESEYYARLKDDAVIESIEANEYEYTAEGKIF